jgi:hypothetical protein
MRDEDGLLILDTAFLIDLFDSLIETVRSEAVQGTDFFVRANLQSGILPAETLRKSVLAHLSGPLQSYIVKLLELFEFISVLPNEDILVPSFLPSSPTTQDLWPTFDPTKIHFFRDYVIRFSPYGSFLLFPSQLSGIFSRLVVKLLQLPYTHHYWRYGVILISDDGACLVSYELQSSRIRLSARGVVEHDIVGLFCNILRIVDALFDDQFQVWCTCKDWPNSNVGDT